MNGTPANLASPVDALHADAPASTPKPPKMTNPKPQPAAASTANAPRHRAADVIYRLARACEDLRISTHQDSKLMLLETRLTRLTTELGFLHAKVAVVESLCRGQAQTQAHSREFLQHQRLFIGYMEKRAEELQEAIRVLEEQCSLLSPVTPSATWAKLAKSAAATSSSKTAVSKKYHDVLKTSAFWVAVLALFVAFLMSVYKPALSAW